MIHVKKVALTYLGISGILSIEVMMNRDFFISLCLATHRVGNVLNVEVGTPLKLGANAVLSRLMFLLEDSLSSSQKKAFAEDALKELESLEKHFELARAQKNINPANFSILEGEYAKVKQFVKGFVKDFVEEKVGEGVGEAGPPSRVFGGLRHAVVPPRRDEGGSKSLRARKILGLLDVKGKAQVWELQKVLPQVTKRTLRRDLDDLVQKGLLERKGQWNTVFYQTKTAD